MRINRSIISTTASQTDCMQQIKHQGNASTVVVSPGRYWVGDPVAVFPEIMDWTVPVQKVEGQQVLAFETDELRTGTFIDSNLIHYKCGSGMLGLIPAALLDCRRMEAMEDGDDGCMVRFLHPVVCLSDDAGTIHFGPNIAIDTRNPA